MRKYILFALAILTASGCSKNPGARINGSFAGLDNVTVYLQTTGGRDLAIVDSTITNSAGDFKFKVDLPHKSPVFYYVIADNSVIPLIISPGEKISLTSVGNLARNYQVEGSPESSLLQEFNTMYNNGMVSLDSLSNLYTSESPVNQIRAREILQEYVKKNNQIKQEQVKFIVTNPSSMAALYALYQRLPNDDVLVSADKDVVYYQMVADSIELRYPESPRLTSLRRDIEEIRKTLAFARQVGNTSEDTSGVPEISLQDLSGKTFNLSDLSGKVIILDFWVVGLESSPIINAEYKELYADFKNKGLEIYQVNMGDQRPDWINAVTTQKLPWITVFDPRGRSGMAAMSYNVTSVPINVIIDSDGNIAARDLYGEGLRRKIEQLTR